MEGNATYDSLAYIDKRLSPNRKVLTFCHSEYTFPFCDSLFFVFPTQPLLATEDETEEQYDKASFTPINFSEEKNVI